MSEPARLDHAAALRRLAAATHCLLWDAEVFDRGAEPLEWRIRVFDEEAAQQFLPVVRAAGQSYADAWYLTRIPEDQPVSDSYGNGQVRLGRGYQQEFRCRRADGEIRWLQEDVQVECVGPGHWRALGLCTDVTERRKAHAHQERLAAGLQTVVSIADELLACPDLDTLLRRAVELARERMGLERCGIYLAENGVARGTYGTDGEGRTADERAHCLPAEPWARHFRARTPQDPRWEVVESGRWEWNGKTTVRVGGGWVVATPLVQEGRQPIGVMFNDTALTGAALDRCQQDLVAVYCSLLGSVIARRQASARQERLLAGLQTVLSIADELLACPALDTVLRRGVELARERLGLERCAIFLTDNGIARGTYGTDREGRTVDERALQWVIGENRDFRPRTADDRRWDIEESPYYSWDGERDVPFGRGWVVTTPLVQADGRPIGAMYNDAARSGAPVDPDLQELVAVYCALLANLIVNRQAGEALELLRSHGSCHVWSGVVREDANEASGYFWELAPLDEQAAQRILPLDVQPGDSYSAAAHRAKLPEDRERLDQDYISALRSGSPHYSHEFRAVDREGVVRWFYEHVTVHVLGPGKWRLVGLVNHITEQRQAAEALRLSERQMQLAIEGTKQVIWSWEPDGPASRMPDATERIFGYPAAEVEQTFEWWLDRLHPDDRERIQESFHSVHANDARSWSGEYRFQRYDGSFAWVIDRALILRDEAGAPVRLLGSMIDVSEQRLLQEQLLQSQKMEAIGRLAGGVAHDFNNLLAVINGYSELLLRGLPAGDPAAGALREIGRAGERAVTLTRQLLAFSRKEITKRQLVNLRESMLGLEKLLRRLIGEDVRLSTVIGPGLGRVYADPGQLEQVLMNLAVNARDAMPLGGTLSIAMENHRVVRPQRCRTGEAPPGEYVLLTVSDTGSGIDPAILPHIFEPFFTTKGVGQGTGLGLATVYAIIQQHGAVMDVESRPGEGTTFRIYLPRAAADHSETAERKDQVAPLVRGTGTVLLVEDEDLVRQLVRTVLQEAGYTVLAAGDGDEALRVCQDQGGAVDLLLTDVVMPGRNGRELADVLTAHYPHVRTLFMSGYTDDAVVRRGVESTGIQYIAKPFTAGALSAKVREILTLG